MHLISKLLKKLFLGKNIYVIEVENEEGKYYAGIETDIYFFKTREDALAAKRYYKSVKKQDRDFEHHKYRVKKINIYPKKTFTNLNDLNDVPWEEWQMSGGKVYHCALAKTVIFA